MCFDIVFIDLRTKPKREPRRNSFPRIGHCQPESLEVPRVSRTQRCNMAQATRCNHRVLHLQRLACLATQHHDPGIVGVALLQATQPRRQQRQRRRIISRTIA